MAVACAALVGMVPQAVRADEVPFANHEMQSLSGLDAFSFDTAWIPGGSPVQLRAEAYLGTDVGLTMDGMAEYDWDFESIRFVGDPLGGLLDLDVTASLVARAWESVTTWLAESGPARMFTTRVRV